MALKRGLLRGRDGRSGRGILHADALDPGEIRRDVRVDTRAGAVAGFIDTDLNPAPAVRRQEEARPPRVAAAYVAQRIVRNESILRESFDPNY